MTFRALALTLFYLLLTWLLKAQEINNLILPPGTPVAPNGTLGKVEKSGSGPIKIILLADAGFEGDIYHDFMRDNKKLYTFFAVTLPGSGTTRPPAMPPSGTSYGERTWLNNAEQAVLNLIEKEKLDRPVIAGNLIVATSIALNLSVHHPEKISRVIIFGGMPRASWPSQKGGPVRPEERIPAIDLYTAPKLYKGMPRDIWNRNLYQPIQFSRDSSRGVKLFTLVSKSSIPVIARYLLEFYTLDIAVDFDKINVPVLVLLPGFDQKYLDENVRFMDSEYFVRGWDKANTNPNFRFVSIPDARIFVWQDQPLLVSSAIKRFLGN